MFPWNENLYIYARAQNFNPAHCAISSRTRSGIVPFLIPTRQENTSNSTNPLLIVQKTGPQVVGER